MTSTPDIHSTIPFTQHPPAIQRGEPVYTPETSPAARAVQPPTDSFREQHHPQVRRESLEPLLRLQDEMSQEQQRQQLRQDRVDFVHDVRRQEEQYSENLRQIAMDSQNQLQSEPRDLTTEPTAPEEQAGSGTPTAPPPPMEDEASFEDYQRLMEALAAEGEASRRDPVFGELLDRVESTVEEARNQGLERLDQLGVAIEGELQQLLDAPRPEGQAPPIQNMDQVQQTLEQLTDEIEENATLYDQRLHSFVSGANVGALLGVEL
ncbi:hypothetical protein [Desulfurispira natronophila]|uniref:Uncharacterized protein n=1 Tax=Desulfurispira natronophila TaxID=682562 RepID=A0A7W8DH56_9BACT|nr:hypothetical protein [Desulfurispira natronophila]MBB5022064.1 hypothetical protein [Desulfurispira natronophila]